MCVVPALTSEVCVSYVTKELEVLTTERMACIYIPEFDVCTEFPEALSTMELADWLREPAEAPIAIALAP
jgi:hypothetical protein